MNSMCYSVNSVQTCHRGSKLAQNTQCKTCRLNPIASFFHEGNIPGILHGLFPVGRNTFLPIAKEKIEETNLSPLFIL